MEKTKILGKALTRAEMKAVNGGFAQCVEGFVCGPPCPDPWGPGGQAKGWACENGIGSACKPVDCYYY